MRLPRERQEENVFRLAQATAEYVGMKAPIPREAIVANCDYVGDGYGIPTEGMGEAVAMFAQEEGILLDPVYSGKAAAGMIDLIRTGTIAGGGDDRLPAHRRGGGAVWLHHVSGRSGLMFASENRILTTHTGSLPRPAALTELYARRVEGGAIDEAELDAAGKAATRHVVRQQIAAGIDVGNNGEQQREAFFLYVRRRMSGFGGGWSRPPTADVVKYPGFRAWFAVQEGLNRAVSNRGMLPQAIGEVRYLDPALIKAECDEFQATLREVDGGFAEPFMTAPSPGIIARALQNEHYDTEDAYLHALGQALRVEYEAIVGAGFLLQIDAPDLALERHITFQDRPLSEFIDFAERVVATINEALVNVPRDRVRIHACWGNYEGPHDCDVDLHDILPAIAGAKVGGLGAAVRQSAPCS